MRIATTVATLVLSTLLVPAGARAATQQITLDGVPVALPGHTSQVITARHTTGTFARVTLWTLRDGRWRQVARTTVGRTGYGGLVNPTTRKQGSGTTPLGTYYLPYSFGSQARHRAWSLPYRKF